MKIHPKSAFFAGGDKGALAALGAHMRLVSTKWRPWGLIYALGPTLGRSGVLGDGFQKSAKKSPRAPKKVPTYLRCFFFFFFARPLPLLRTRAGHSVWFPLAWRAMASFEVAPSQAAFAFRTLQVVKLPTRVRLRVNCCSVEMAFRAPCSCIVVLVFVVVVVVIESYQPAAPVPAPCLSLKLK